jgi:hypothetical protein
MEKMFVTNFKASPSKSECKLIDLIMEKIDTDSSQNGEDDDDVIHHACVSKSKQKSIWCFKQLQ